jgi:hypothetical protein
LRNILSGLREEKFFQAAIVCTCAVDPLARMQKILFKNFLLKSIFESISEVEASTKPTSRETEERDRIESGA